jgi:hypothetical protein
VPQLSKLFLNFLTLHIHGKKVPPGLNGVEFKDNKQAAQSLAWIDLHFKEDEFFFFYQNQPFFNNKGRIIRQERHRKTELHPGFSP